MNELRIRTTALCVLYRAGKILVFEGYDASIDETFYRPLGWGVLLGETAADAVVREIREEIGAVISNVRQLGVLENIFEFEESPGHQIMFIFDAEFDDQSLYERKIIAAQEHGDDPRTPIEDFEAIWIDLADVESGQKILYPEGLLDLILAEST